MAVLCYEEDTASFRFLMQSLLSLNYPFRSLTTDLGKGFVKEAPAQAHAGCQSIYRAILKYQDGLKQYYQDEAIHNNSNTVECVISHVSVKINQGKKFESFLGAYYTMTLSMLYWRLHHFSASRYGERNGKSPLFLAKSQHDVHGNWIDVFLSIKTQGECDEGAVCFRKPIYISQEGIVNLQDECLLEYKGN